MHEQVGQQIIVLSFSLSLKSTNLKEKNFKLEKKLKFFFKQESFHVTEQFVFDSNNCNSYY